MQNFAARLARHGLEMSGGFDIATDPAFPEDASFLALIGTDTTRFWPIFSASPEYRSGHPHAMDVWSRRVISQIIDEISQHGIELTAYFPFGGPPWLPFTKWAEAGEGACVSKAALQISPRRGLWMAYRAAIALPFTPDSLPKETPKQSPCEGCPAPCTTSCPVDAIRDGVYDVDTCRTHLRSGRDVKCHDGCLVRLACPVGTPPVLEQRRFHMRAFTFPAA